jgi:hypothetical protein
VQVPPPPHFKAVVGKPHSVNFKPNPFKNQRGDTPAKQAGIRYEELAHGYLANLPLNYVERPFFHFHDNTGWRTCAPDGMFLHSEWIAIVEIKYQHVPEAWWQLRRLYEPVLRAFCKQRALRLVEVVRSYDAATPFPETPALAYDLPLWLTSVARDGEFAVHRWSGRDGK